MVQNLFAACRHNGSLVARRIKLDSTIQRAVEDLFERQERQFRDGIVTEVDFNGSWSPEQEELLTINIPQEAEVFEETINSNATSIQEIDTTNFCNENIKALFTGTIDNNRNVKVLIQRFTSNQFLHRKWSFLQDGNSFRELSEPAFSLDSSLTSIIEDGKIKFKSQFKLRSIIDMQDIYREATDQEVRDFADHDSLEISSLDNFIETADQTTRKLISAITSSNNLNNYSVEQIKNAALRVGVQISVNDDKIVIPEAKADIKNLLRFLDDSLYEAALTGQRYITNSKRIA